MATKYLSFTTDNGKELVNAGAISFVKLNSATKVEMYELTGAKKFELTTTGATQEFVDSINESLQQAAETSWHKAVVPVANEGVTSITKIEVA